MISTITRIQVEGNDTVSFLTGGAPPYQYVQGMSQIMPQVPTYISYGYDSITITQDGSKPFQFSVYSITDVGGNVFTALTFQNPSSEVQARTIEIYRLLVTSIFKGCCECGNTEPECSIQYTAGTDPSIPGTLWDVGGVGMRINYYTANSQDFRGFWPIIQDGSWIFVFSKTDPTVYGVYQLSNYSDGGDFAQFDSTLLAGPAGFPDGTALCVDVTSVGGSLVQDWQDTLNISSLLTQDNTIDGGGFNFEWGNVFRYILNSTSYQDYRSDNGSGAGFVRIDPGAVTLNATSYIDIITPGHATAGTGWVLAKDASGHVEYVEAGTGTISSIELLMPPAFTVSDPNPLITDGTFTVTVDGTEDQYINGLGELADLPVYTVENGLHAFGGVPGEAPPDPFLFHLGGLLIEDTTITVTNGGNEYALGVAGLAGQDTQQPFGVSNLGDGGVATFQDYGSGNRPNPSVEVVGDVDLYQPLLELRMEGNLPGIGVLEDRTALLRLKYDGDPSLARMSIDYQFKNDDANPSAIYFIGGRLTTEITNFTANAEESNFELQLFSTGSRGVRMVMEGKGQLELTNYATGSFWNGDTNINNALTYVLAVDGTGKVWKKAATGGGTVQSVGAAGLLTTTATNPFTVSGTVTTNMATNRLVGRYSAGDGIMQEIVIGSGLTLTGDTLTAEGGTGFDVEVNGTLIIPPATVLDLKSGTDIDVIHEGGGVVRFDYVGSAAGYNSDQGVYKDTSLTPETFMLGAPTELDAVDIQFETNRFVNTQFYTFQIKGNVGDDVVGGVVNLINENLGESITLNVSHVGSGTAIFVRQNGVDNSGATAIGIQSIGSPSTLANPTNGIVISDFGGSDDFTSLFIRSESDNTIPINIIRNAQVTPNLVEKFMVLETGQFPQVSNMGGSIDFKIQTTTFVYQDSNKLITRWTDATNATRTSQFEIQGVNNGSAIATQLTLKGTGQLQLNNYTTATSFDPESGPSIGVLNVDNVGNVFVGEGGGGGTYDSDQGVYKDTSLTNDTFMLGAPSGSQGSIPFTIDRYIDVADKFLQMEGSSYILKLKEGTGVLTNKPSVISVASDADSYAGAFTATNKIAIFASTSGTDVAALEVYNSGSGTDSYAATFQADDGHGILVNSTTNNLFQIESASPTSIDNIISLYKTPTAAGSIGEGISLSFGPGADSGSNILLDAVVLNSIVSDATDSSASVDFRIDTYSAGVSLNNATFIADGQLKLHEYGQTPANFPDASPVWALGVDSTGNVVEFDVPTGGGGIPFGIATGTDTYAVSAGTATTYTDGDAYLVRFTNGNTGGSTLNVNGIGDADMYSSSDGLLIGGDIWADAQMLCVYNSSLPGFQCIGTSPNSLFAYVTNAETTAITKGMAVYAFGGTGDRLTVKKALATGDSTSAQTVGIVYSASIGANQKGIIMIQGELVDLSLFPTSGGPENWIDGEPVYLSSTTAGGVTKVKQYAPNHLVYLGICVKASNGTGGRMYVRIQNGFELDELHNVQAQTPADKDTLWYDNSATPKQWKTASVPSLSGTFSIGVTVDGSGGTITVGQKGYVQIPYACTITGWRIITNATGTLIFDVDKAASGTIPTLSITGSAPPTLGAGQQTTFSSTLTGWTTAISANDMLGFTVDSAATVSWAILQLFVTKS